MNFLPTLPEQVDTFARVALLLLGAIGLAEWGQRWLRLPRLTGYVLAGILMGPGVLQWAPLSISGDLRPLMLLGLGLLLFELGSKVDLRWLGANKMLILTSVTEAGFTFIGVYTFLAWAGFVPATCMTVAAISVSTSPTVVMRIVAENNARGQMTQRLLLLTALNSLYAILLLKIGVAFVHFNQKTDLWAAIAHPLYITSGSFLLAVLVALAMRFAYSTGLQRESERFSAVLAVLLITSTVADGLGLSVPMVLLCGGMILRSRSQRLVLFPEHFGSAGALLVILLFVLTGLALTPSQIVAGGVMSLGLLLIRGSAKYLGAWWSAGRGGLAPQKANWLGIALLPMSSLAVLQAYEVSELYPDFGDDIVAIVLGAVVVMELLGPILTQLALRRVGEASPPDISKTTYAEKV